MALLINMSNFIQKLKQIEETTLRKLFSPNTKINVSHNLMGNKNLGQCSCLVYLSMLRDLRGIQWEIWESEISLLFCILTLGIWNISILKLGIRNISILKYGKSGCWESL